jgi:CHAT domain-containing protein
MSDVPRHPEAQVMAAFVDGTLAPNEIAAVAGHLRDCADCRTVVSETARFEREEESTARPRRNAWWLAAAAAAIVAIVIAVPLLRPRTPIGKLIAASPREHRTVEARLSGFAWARLAPPSRGVARPDPADLKLAGAAGEVLEKTNDAHATGVAYLLIQRDADAISALEHAADRSTDPRVWNDLAAARYALAVRDDHPSQLPEALADSDHALRLDPKSAEALFNRALVIEAMGLRDQARTAWQKYLEADGGSGWAVEAREHLRKLEQHSRRFDRKLLDSLPADQLVREFQQDARTWGETVLLAEWAKAPSDAKLARIRAIADSLVRFNGEPLLADATFTAENAAGEKRAALIRAHVLYFDARLAYSRRRVTEAEKQLRDAAALFERAGSPMSGEAWYYAACAALDQNRVDESRNELERLRARIDRGRYRALVAQIESELALAANIAGDWGTAVREATASAAAFMTLGERSNAAAVDAKAAHALDLIGDSDMAWRRRIRVLENLDAESQRDRRSTILYGSAIVLRSLQHNAAAAAMLDLQIEQGRQGNAVMLALACADLARLDPESPRDLFAEARKAANRIDDRTLRETSLAQIDLAAATARVSTEPRAALAVIDQSTSFFAQRQLRALLPDAYLQRARAARAAGDENGATAGYDAALQEIEKQRQTIQDADLRASFLDTAEQVIDDLIELNLARGDVARAFAAADRARGPGHVPPTIANGAGIVEYVVLPRAIAIFCLSSRGVAAQKIDIDRAALDVRVTSFAEGIRKRATDADVKRDAGALYQLLIAPIEADLGGVTEVILIPDRRLNAVPFAALYDARRNRYLVQQFTIRFAPSAGDTQRVTEEALQPALVVADPPSQNLPRLLASRDEAMQIAAMHKGTLLAGDNATRARFLAAAPLASLIHYSGHADSNTTDSYGALLLARDGDESGVVSSSDLARLRLTRHPVVVLAACGTFRGDPMHVAGMASISRAFLTAGARSVIGTLWEIDDDVAAAMFRRFHERLRSGAPPARALRDAQIDMLESPDERLRQPATWAPIELLSHV